MILQILPSDHDQREKGFEMGFEVFIRRELTKRHEKDKVRKEQRGQIR